MSAYNCDVSNIIESVISAAYCNDKLNIYGHRGF